MQVMEVHSDNFDYLGNISKSNNFLIVGTLSTYIVTYSTYPIVFLVVFLARLVSPKNNTNKIQCFAQYIYHTISANWLEGICLIILVCINQDYSGTLQGNQIAICYIRSNICKYSYQAGYLAKLSPSLNSSLAWKLS